MNDKEIKILLTVLEQNWLHARHVENERLWITNIYVLIVAGVLSFLRFNEKGANLKISLSIIILFLIFFSLLNLFIIIKLNNEFKNHIKKIDKIVSILRVKQYMGLPERLRLEHIKEYFIKFRITSVRYIFIYFYILTIILFLVLLILNLIGKI